MGLLESSTQENPRKILRLNNLALKIRQTPGVAGRLSIGLKEVDLRGMTRGQDSVVGRLALGAQVFQFLKMK
jgi:hypothetical protein